MQKVGQTRWSHVHMRSWLHLLILSRHHRTRIYIIMDHQIEPYTSWTVHHQIMVKSLVIIYYILACICDGTWTVQTTCCICCYCRNHILPVQYRRHITRCVVVYYILARSSNHGNVGTCTVPTVQTTCCVCCHCRCSKGWYIRHQSYSGQGHDFIGFWMPKMHIHETL